MIKDKQNQLKDSREKAALSVSSPGTTRRNVSKVRTFVC